MCMNFHFYSFPHVSEASAPTTEADFATLAPQPNAHAGSLYIERTEFCAPVASHQVFVKLLLDAVGKRLTLRRYILNEIGIKFIDDPITLCMFWTMAHVSWTENELVAQTDSGDDRDRHYANCCHS